MKEHTPKTAIPLHPLVGKLEFNITFQWEEQLRKNKLLKKYDKACF